MSDQAELFWWAVGLIVGVPLAVIALGEISDRLRRNNSPYAVPAEMTRTVAVPAALAYMLSRAILGLESTNPTTQIAKTVLLIAIGYVGFIWLRLIGREKRQTRWENKVPSLFKILLRIAIIVVPVLIIFDTWGIDLTSNLSALGIGGLAIAFALQDAIGGVVSGVLLVVDRPFSVGDWIEVDGMHGEVIDISWRSTRIRIDADIVILPNTTLAGSSIRNLTANDPSHDSSLDFSFGSDDRPADVKAMLLDVAADNPAISTSAQPEVHTTEFGDSAITYRLHYKLDRYEGDVPALRVQDELRSAVFYAHARRGLSMPYPIIIQLDERALAEPDQAIDHARASLGVNSLFGKLPKDVLDELSRHLAFRVYHAGETVLSPERLSTSISLITTGQAEMYPAMLGTSFASTHMSTAVGPGELLGEQALVSHTGGDWRVVARTDVELYEMPVDVVRAVVEQHGQFARSLNALMQERGAKLRAFALSGPDSVGPMDASNDMTLVDLSDESTTSADESSSKRLRNRRPA